MNAKEALKLAALGLDALQIIQSLTRIGGDKAQQSLEAIDRITTTIQNGVEGRASLEAVTNELEHLKASIEANDDTFDRRLRERFKED